MTRPVFVDRPGLGWKNLVITQSSLVPRFVWQRFGGEIREAFAPKVSQKLQPCNFGFAVLIEPCDVEVWAPPPLSLQRSFRFLHVS
jgi:hypothetical protein